ncbi:MAG: DNA-3-methyladenine glycosylase [Bryobacteraceae bacterium]
MKKAITHLRQVDPVMAAIIDRVGPYAVRYNEPTFHTLVRSITYQQLSGKAAATIFGRLAAAAKVDPITPESILKLRPARMRTLGLSGQKMEYIRTLARMTRDGEVSFESLAKLEDAAVIEHLTRVRGVGVWTVQMFLMFALKRRNVLPTGDLGIRAAMKKAYALEELPKPTEMEKLAAGWHPYCTIASWYLWRSLDGEAAL